MRFRTLVIALMLVTVLMGCSIDISTDPAATSTVPAPTQPLPQPTSESTDPPTQVVGTLAPTDTPIPWAGPGATGRVFFTQNDRGIIILDMSTGKQTTLYAPAPNAWVRAASVSVDGKLIVMAYAPPPPAGQVQLGFSDLFVMSIDGSMPPTPVLRHSGPSELFVTPVWSPDGKYIYYGHFVTNTTSVGPTVTYSLNRIGYPGGQPELVAADAFWPQFSPDGSKIVYIAYDVTADISDLMVSDLDGSNPQLALPSGSFVAVDAPLFYPDGEHILFSAVGDNPSAALNWLDKLFGVQTAYAHDVPSDFWRVSLSTGETERLTRLQAVGMFADFSPDGELMAFITTTGVYVSKPDGTELKTLVDVQLSGTLEWLP